MTRLLFVGESPPMGAAPDFNPFDCQSGTRLATIMLGLKDRATMLAHTERTNIFASPCGVKGAPPWIDSVARVRGSLVAAKAASHGTRTIVALGRRPAAALGMPDPLNCPSYNWAPAPLTTWRLQVTDVGDKVTVIYAPHPSGASTALQDPVLRADARAALMPELVIASPTLRPWHFRLDDPAVLAALSAAVSPLCPALGTAALTLAASMHTTREARLALPILARDTAAKTLAPWDVSLGVIVITLLREDGARVLSRAWHGEERMATAIVNAAKPHVAVNAMQTRSTMRATLARYREAGLT